MTDIDRSWAAMPPEAQAEYLRIFGTEEEQYELSWPVGRSRSA